MKKIIYIGTKQPNAKSNPTTIDVLSRRLAKEGYCIKSASAYQNQIIRMLHMISLLIRNFSSTHYVLIDTYSTRNFWYAVSIAAFCRLGKLRYIPILHGGNLPYRLENNPYWSQFIFSNAFANVSPSVYLQKSFENKGYSNIILIPNAIDLSEYHFQERTLQKTVKIAWVRALASIYNPEMALEVAAILQKKYNIQLQIIGPDKENLSAQIILKAQKLNIHFDYKGAMTPAQWHLTTNDACLFLVTTHFDNAPVSVLEAMALGMPVAATAVGGLPYFINHLHNGVLAKENDAADMAQQIMAVLDKNKIQEMSQNARIFAEQFDWEIIKHQWKKLLV